MEYENRSPTTVQVIEEDISLEKTRGYVCEVYPDSAPDNWRDRIKSWHIPFLVSPLHEGELKEDGSEKKPHWHIILFFAGNKTPGQVLELISQFGGVAPPKKSDFMVQHINGACRYLYHADDPDKKQYNKNDVEVYGPIDFESLCMSDKESSNLLMDITIYVFNHKITSFIKFMMMCAYKKRDWWEYVTKKGTFFVKSIIQSNAEDVKAAEDKKE